MKGFPRDTPNLPKWKELRGLLYKEVENVDSCGLPGKPELLREANYVEDGVAIFIDQDVFL